MRTPPIVRRRLLAFTALLMGSACNGADSSESVGDSRGASVPALNDRGSPESARDFVQTFYDWYAAIPDGSAGPTYYRVLSHSPAYLTADLASALRGDSLVRSLPGEPREYLNGDPILASQDPCPRYQVTNVNAEGQGYRVAVKPLCSDPRGESAGPVLEIRQDSGSWRIANIFFEGTNLRRLLCEYAMRDSRVAVRPARCE